MDFSALSGFLVGCAVFTLLVFLTGGSLYQYLDTHAFLTVFGGSFAATLIRFPFSVLWRGIRGAFFVSFSMRSISPRFLVEEITRAAEIARRKGLLALEQLEVSDPSLRIALSYVADGYESALIREILERDREQISKELDESQRIFRLMGESAPAFGMVGTLIGMVNMFAHMTDPSKLGPYMAIALLATLYGAILANLVCIPIADKIYLKIQEEEVCRNIILDGVIQIRNAKSPQLIKDMLTAYLLEQERRSFVEESLSR